MAILLMLRRLCLANRATAAEESVDDGAGTQQIGDWGEAAFSTTTIGVGSPRGFPVGPACRDQRPATVWKHNEQQQSAAAPDGPHDLQRATLKRVPLTQNCC